MPDAPIYRTTISLRRGSGAAIGPPVSSIQDQGEIFEVFDVPSPSTNLELAIAFTLASLKSILIFTDGTLTLKTNDATTPDQTFSLAAGKYLQWDTNSLMSNPISANVTKMFATVAGGGSTVQLTIAVLRDATP